MNKKLLIGIITAVIIALTAGILVYNNLPATKLRRQMELGNKYVAELDYEQAVAAFEKALEIIPDDETAKTELVQTYLKWASDLEQDEDYEEAAVIIDSALQIFPQNAALIQEAESIKRAKQIELSDADKHLFEGLTDYLAFNVLPQYVFDSNSTDYKKECIVLTHDDMREEIDGYNSLMNFHNIVRFISSYESWADISGYKELYEEDEYGSKYILHGELERCRKVCKQLFGITLDVGKLYPDEKGFFGEGYLYNKEFDELILCTGEDGYLPYLEFEEFTVNEDNSADVRVNYSGDESYDGYCIIHINPAENDFGYMIEGAELHSEFYF